ncbi:MAG: alpha/beta hydrolase [Candidatus Rokuibacteriota bacterium]|nr:MAG: alpha/beta hydrolase [Candidatus Rokubacteria bacterium]
MAAHAAGAPTPRRHVVKSNGVGLAAYEWPGGGPAVIAIHGLTSNHTAWYPIADVLAGRHRLIAHDLRGRGDSEKPDKGYSLAEHSADLLGLLDHFGLERAIVMGHSLGAHIGVHFASHHGDRVAKLVLVDGGLDVRAEVFDSIAPSVNRLGVEFPSVEMFLAIVQTLPMFAGRWNDHLARHFTYDVEPGPGGGVRSKVARHSIEEEVTNLQRTRLWAWHHRIAAPTLLLRAPDGLLTADDCLMTQEEAEAMAHAIPDCRLVVVPGTNHYTILLGDHPLVRRELAAFLAP